MSTGAAVCFATGGLLIKPSDGLRQVAPTVGVLGLFFVGTFLLARTVQLGGEVGPAYLVVAGFETILVFVLGVLLFDETIDLMRVGAVAMIVTGTLVLA